MIAAAEAFLTVTERLKAVATENGKKLFDVEGTFMKIKKGAKGQSTYDAFGASSTVWCDPDRCGGAEMLQQFGS